MDKAKCIGAFVGLALALSLLTCILVVVFRKTASDDIEAMTNAGLSCKNNNLSAKLQLISCPRDVLLLHTSSFTVLIENQREFVNALCMQNTTRRFLIEQIVINYIELCELCILFQV